MQKQLRGITVRTLNSVNNSEIVRTIINEQIRIIDAKILSAHQAGFRRVEHELPSNFDINNLDKMDAQTLIYSEIISIYKSPISENGKGFVETYINIGPTTHLIIQWKNAMDESERERRRQLIKSAIK